MLYSARNISLSGHGSMLSIPLEQKCFTDENMSRKPMWEKSLVFYTFRRTICDRISVLCRLKIFMCGYEESGGSLAFIFMPSILNSTFLIFEFLQISYSKGSIPRQVQFEVSITSFYIACGQFLIKSSFLMLLKSTWEGISLGTGDKQKHLKYDSLFISSLYRKIVQ